MPDLPLLKSVIPPDMRKSRKRPLAKVMGRTRPPSPPCDDVLSTRRAKLRIQCHHAHGNHFSTANYHHDVMRILFCSNKWSKNFHETLHRMSCCYWKLNNPFCCVYRSRDSPYFSVDRKTPKIANSGGGYRFYLTHTSLHPSELAVKRHLNRSIRFYTVHQCDQHTTLRVTSVASQYAASICHACNIS